MNRILNESAQYQLLNSREVHPQVHLSNVMPLCIKQIAASPYFTSKSSAFRSASAEEEP